MPKRITNEQLYEALTAKSAEMCPATKEQYDQHCEFINFEREHREKREKILNDTAKLLSKAMHELSLIKDRVLIIETKSAATWKMIVGTSLIVGILSSVGTLLGAVIMFSIKIKSNI